MKRLIRKKGCSPMDWYNIQIEAAYAIEEECLEMRKKHRSRIELNIKENSERAHLIKTSEQSFRMSRNNRVRRNLNIEESIKFMKKYGFSIEDMINIYKNTEEEFQRSKT